MAGSFHRRILLCVLIGALFVSETHGWLSWGSKKKPEDQSSAAKSREERETPEDLDKRIEKWAEGSDLELAQMKECCETGRLAANGTEECPTADGDELTCEKITALCCRKCSKGIAKAKEKKTCSLRKETDDGPLAAHAFEDCCNEHKAFMRSQPRKGWTANSTSCITGFELAYDPYTRLPNCVDIDECRLVPRVCSDPNSQCINTLGSYMCICAFGFAKESEDEPCKEKDVCTDYGDACWPPDIATCKPALAPGNVGTGAYLCECAKGYSIHSDNKTLCDDINECELRTHDCTKPGTKCVNDPGSFHCECADGYRKNKKNGECEDIDECEESEDDGDGICGKNGKCTNTRGSYTCSCKDGYVEGVEIDEDDFEVKTCVDLDECETGQHNCMAPAACNNTVGSFECFCPTGYAQDADAPNRCVDIDECAEDEEKDLCQGECRNTIGSYECVCPQGYSPSLLDKSSCVPDNPCEDADRCRGDGEVCVMTSGGEYNCVLVECPTGYANLAQDPGVCILDARNEIGNCSTQIPDVKTLTSYCEDECQDRYLKEKLEAMKTEKKGKKISKFPRCTKECKDQCAEECKSKTSEQHEKMMKACNKQLADLPVSYSYIYRYIPRIKKLKEGETRHIATLMDSEVGDIEYEGEPKLTLKQVLPLKDGVKQVTAEHFKTQLDLNDLYEIVAVKDAIGPQDAIIEVKLTGTVDGPDGEPITKTKVYNVYVYISEYEF